MTFRSPHIAAFDQTFRSLLGWAVFVLVAICYLLPLGTILYIFGGHADATRQRFLHLTRQMQRLAVRLAPNVHVQIHNAPNEQFAPPAIVICNHQSMWEILVCLSLSNHMTVLMKEAYVRNPFLRLLAHMAGYHFTTNQGEQLFAELQADVQKGYSVLIFPEGTRTLTGELGTFRQGAFFVAERLQLDIVPIVVRGAFQVMPKGRYIPQAGTISLDIQPRIAPTDLQYGRHFRKRTHSIEDYYRQQLSASPL